MWVEGWDNHIESVSTSIVNDDMIDFIDHHLSSRENLKNQNTKQLLDNLRHEAFQKPETIVKEWLEPRSFGNKIEFTQQDQQEFIDELDQFLELHPDNQDAQFTKNLYDFLFKMVREEQLETTFPARSAKEVMGMIDTPEFRKAAWDIKITLVSEWEGDPIIMLPNKHWDQNWVLGPVNQIVQREIFTSLEALYRKSISNIVMIEWYNNNFDINKDSTVSENTYIDLQEKYHQIMLDSGVPIELHENLTDEEIINKYFPVSKIFEMKHGLNVYSIGIEDQSRTRALSEPEHLSVEESKLQTTGEYDMYLLVAKIFIEYSSWFENRSYQQRSKQLIMNVWPHLEDNTTHVGKQFAKLVEQRNQGKLSASTFILSFLREFDRLDELFKSGRSKMDVITGATHNNARQQVTLDNINMLSNKFNTPKILIYGDGHFDRKDHDILEEGKSFEQMCRERNLSCILIVTKSQQENFESDE